MLAPSRAKSAATARPIPLSAPVIRATLPLRRSEPLYRGSQSGLGSSWLSWPGSWSSWTIGSMTSDIDLLLRRDSHSLALELFDRRLGCLVAAKRRPLRLVLGALRLWHSLD